MNEQSLIYGFIIFIVFILINIIYDFGFSILNKIFYKRLFKFNLILNDVYVDHDRIRNLLNLSNFTYQLYLKGIFLFNREQILMISTYLGIDPNDVYTIKII